jgi:hypothetical protein
MSEFEVTRRPPAPRARALLLPMALGTLGAWLAVAAAAGVAAALGAPVVRDRLGRPITGPAGLGAVLASGAVLGALAAAVGCLGTPLGLRLYAWRETRRARAAAAAAAAAAAGRAPAA